MDKQNHQTSTLGRLKKRSEFLYVRNGHYQARGAVVIQARKNPDHAGLRVGFTATKKIGNAVIRNRAKRRLREIARDILPEYGIPGTDYVFIARQNTCLRPYSDLVDDVKNALKRLARR